MPRRLLQPTLTTFGFGLPESRRLRRGYNGRSGCGVDATRPRNRCNSTSTLLNLFILPSLYLRFGKSKSVLSRSS